MKTYRVMWDIDIDADSPLEAAIKALTIQRDPDSIATRFEVTRDEEGQRFEVDLLTGSVVDMNEK